MILRRRADSNPVPRVLATVAAAVLAHGSAQAPVRAYAGKTMRPRTPVLLHPHVVSPAGASVATGVH